MSNVARHMKLKGPSQQDLVDEIEVLQRMLDFDHKTVLELGCGAAEKTRQIAEQTRVSKIIAAEVDKKQHEKNLKISDLPQVTFKDYGAESIHEPDQSVDIVLMFKSLHHVPLDLLDQSFAEIARVLKPGGQVYISEPVFEGAFNHIMRVFHDEEHVRQVAFDSIKAAISSGDFDLMDEYFFRNQIRLTSFEQYESRILNVTHTDHKLSNEQYEEVKHRFLANESEEGFVFQVPNRVDLLKKAVN